jgi:hypothetical protein
MPSFAITTRFESAAQQRTDFRNRYDSVAVDQKAGFVFRYESGAKYNGQYRFRFDADNITPHNGINIRFDTEGRGLCQVRNAFHAMREFVNPVIGITGKFEWQRSYDTGTNARFDKIRPSYMLVSNQFDAIFYQKHGGINSRFDTNAVMLMLLPGTFDVIPGYQNTLTIGRFSMTTISWSSNSGDYSDCEFGLWFSELPPVVTLREPDQRITYTAFDVDYKVRITQTWPLWCVVMAVKGNMRGPANEIYLAWSNDAPRRPDDQMAFDVYIDENLPQRKTDASVNSDNVGWDTSAGYW